MATDWWTSNQPPAGGSGGYSADQFRRIVGRDPSAEETAFYGQAPDWQAQLQRNTPQADQQQAGNRYAQATGTNPGGGWEAGGGVKPAGMMGAAPSYYNPQDPTHQAVWQAFQAKGIQPRDEGDFNYWVNHITQSGGLEKGYQNEGGTGTWADRMASASGGVGDYGGGSGAGGGIRMGGLYNSGGGGMTADERRNYGVPDQPYSSSPYSGGFDPATVPDWLKGPFTAPTKEQLEGSPGYQARLDAQNRTLDRSAAAKGSILSGGFLTAAGERAQDYASNEYGNLFGQNLATRGQNQGEFQQNVVAPRMFQQSNQYKQYLDDQNRTLNDYLTNYNINRTGVQDFLTQNNRTADRGLSALSYGRPG